MKKRMVLVLVPLVLISVYALMWVFSVKKYPVEYGISFSSTHAEYLGLDWRQTYRAMLDELHPKYLRIAAAWNSVEKERESFDFTDVDWQMDEAAKRGTKVTLVVGQKAPRWPECHVPDWHTVTGDPAQKDLFNYVSVIVERYKNHPALERWQVENEPFIGFTFGDCAGYDRTVVDDEIKLVRTLDSGHPVVLTDSGELGRWVKASRGGDFFGTTLYRVVRTPGGHVIKYDFMPAAFYRWKAHVLGISMDRFFVAELQAEPWFMSGDPMSTPIEEQEETMNPDRLVKHLDYTERIGVSRAYLWGVEWWYFMKEKMGDVRYWDIIQKKLQG